MRLSRLDYEFVGSPADDVCARIDYQARGFDLTIFKGPTAQKSFYMEPHKNAHQKGMQALNDARKQTKKLH